MVLIAEWAFELIGVYASKDRNVVLYKMVPAILRYKQSIAVKPETKLARIFSKARLDRIVDAVLHETAVTRRRPLSAAEWTQLIVPNYVHYLCRH